jgi:phosphate transport system substrate-binding protein
MKAVFSVAAAIALVLSFPARSAEIVGAGSSAAASLYASWAAEWSKKSATSLQYAAVGSSAGLKAIREGKADFGASDVALAPADLERDGLVDFPTAISGIVPMVNLPGVPAGELHLSGPLLADMLAGRVARWNAPQIAALNKSLRLPDLPIKPVAREDGSGTTYVLSHYLAQVSPAWAKDFGSDFKLKWPEGTTLAKGTSAMVETVAKTPGAIGYAEYGAVVKAKAGFARVANRHGDYPAPSAESFRNALKGSGWTASGKFEEMLTDSPEKDAWPITGGTFIVMRKTAADPARIAKVLSFFSYGFLRGDEITSQNGWIALPELTQARVVKEMNRIRDKDAQPLSWDMNF